MMCISERGKLHHTYCMFMIQILCIRKRETVSYLQCVHDLNFFIRKREPVSYLQYVYVLNFVLSERGKLHHTYNMFMFQIVCIRKRETVSCLEYVYDLDCLYQKRENCIMPTICLLVRFCVSERGKPYHAYSMFMIQILCTRKWKTVSFLQHFQHLYFVYQKEGTCIIPTLCLCSRSLESE